MSANQHERLTSEIAEERTARLQQTNTHQRDRLVNETAEEREARLQYYSDKHRELYRCSHSCHCLLQARVVMLRFHAHMASLNSPQCATCSERFPGLRLCSLPVSTECVCCSHDKYSPKVNSAANNGSCDCTTCSSLCLSL